MGFHKRFVTKESILLTNKNQIDTFFGADALLFSDDWSSEFYRLYQEGHEYNQIIEKLKDYEND